MPRYYVQFSAPTDGGVPRSEVKVYVPKTGAERMRELRRRNPGYDRAYKARHRIEVAALVQRMAEKARQAAIVRQPVVLMLPAPAVRLMLPAPVVDPAMEAIKALAKQLTRQTVAA